jgi:D-sedoheptulose 7-phosphate isomerase
VAVGISTSGGSRNSILALEEVRKRKLPAVALLGYDAARFYGAAWWIFLS